MNLNSKPLGKKQNTIQNTGIYANTDCRLENTSIKRKDDEKMNQIETCNTF